MDEHFWNHRVVKQTYPSPLPNGEPETLYSVRETHYNPNGSIYAYTMEPSDLACETLEDLLQYTEWCLKSIKDAIADRNQILVDGEVEFVDYGDPIPEEGSAEEAALLLELEKEEKEDEQ